MAKTRIQKEDIVTRLADELNKAKSVVFADYKGLNMSQLDSLRQQLEETGATFSITKNSLLKIAMQNLTNSYQLPSTTLEGPTATLMAFEDEISPIKVLVKALKDFQIGSVKAGVLDGEVIDQYKINKLASLPSKDELRAKVVGSLGSPLYGIVGVLQANLRNLVYALDQIRVSKGGV